jgi:hypothetical protein
MDRRTHMFRIDRQQRTEAANMREVTRQSRVSATEMTQSAGQMCSAAWAAVDDGRRLLATEARGERDA